MDKLEAMTARKAILGWRERWTKLIGERLQEDSSNLQSLLYSEIDGMSFLNAFFFKRFTSKKLQPIFVEWSNAEAHNLICDAEADLLKICEQSVPRHSSSSQLDPDNALHALKDIAGATLSSAMAFAAIPAVVTFSTATVSVGGFLGFLGVTTSVVVFKQLALGVLALVAVWLLATMRVKKIQTNCQARLKLAVQKQIKDKILYSKNHKSLNLTLNELIEETANKLIGELKNAR